MRMRRSNRSETAFAALCFSIMLAVSTQAEDVDSPDAFTLFQREMAMHPLYDTLREGTVPTSVGTYHYVELGKGPLLILYHGFPSFWYAWKSLMPALAEHFRVIALDGLGANRTAKPDDLELYRIESLAAQLGEIIHFLNDGDPVYLVGHDWGGALVWSFAQAVPQQVVAVASLSAPPFNLFLELLSSSTEQRHASAYMERLKNLAKFEELPEDAAARMTHVGYRALLKKGLISDSDFQAFEQGLSQEGALSATAAWYAANIPRPDSIREQDFWPSRQGTTSAPALLLWGEDDRTFVRRLLDLAPAYAETLQVVTLPGVGHWPMFEATDQSRTTLLKFLLDHSQD